MRFNILCVVLLVVVYMAMVESHSSSNKLKRFLIKVSSWKKSNSNSQQLQSVLANLRNRVAIIFKRKQSSSSSNTLPSAESSEECDEVSDGIEELYKDLCDVNCTANDYYCNKVISRYIKPLCVYKDALKASKALIVKIGCKQMRYREKLICKTNSKKACELAEEVADFCEAADASDADCGKQTPTPKPKTPRQARPTPQPKPQTPPQPEPQTTTQPQTTNTTTPATTTTTTPATTTQNPGPIASDFRCDTFVGQCFLGSCPSNMFTLDICDLVGYVCCKVL